MDMTYVLCCTEQFFIKLRVRANKNMRILEYYVY